MYVQSINESNALSCNKLLVLCGITFAKILKNEACIKLVVHLMKLLCTKLSV